MYRSEIVSAPTAIASRGAAARPRQRARGWLVVLVAPLAAASLAGCRSNDMVAIPGGTFTMRQSGSTVTVAAYELDRTEVTAAAYTECVLAGACTPVTTTVPCPNGTYGVPSKQDHPINCVDWNQASSYCSWKKKRLPSDEEWEWAARGQARATTYPWGNDEPDSRACWKQEGTCAVGSHPAGDAPGGIHDLAGNVWEWTSGKSVNDSRAYRGGSWGNQDAQYLRATMAFRGMPTLTYDILGFRCAR